ncbi:MAG: ABC-2 family transporter protein [Deltaproteobacteria bacterium]|nr:ABC-2 family transporter protein [Deltaproteobacteria bacterium]
MRSLRTLAALFRINLLLRLNFRFDLSISFIIALMPMATLFFWKRAIGEGSMGVFTDEKFTAYIFVIVAVTALGLSGVANGLTMEIRTGGLSQALLRPHHPLLNSLAVALADITFGLFFAALFIGGELLFVGPQGLAQDREHWLLLPVAMLGALIINFAVQVIIAELSFFWESALALWPFYLGLFYVFSGAFVPLSFFPEELRRIVDLSPFPYLTSLPTELALGLRSVDDGLSALRKQWAYVIILIATVLVLWWRGLRRYEAYGG